MVSAADQVTKTTREPVQVHRCGGEGRGLGAGDELPCTEASGLWREGTVCATSCKAAVAAEVLQAWWKRVDSVRENGREARAPRTREQV